MKIRIGTRASKLALWQAEHVANLLHQGGLETEVIPMDTLGDKILDVSISKIGSKGVFTEEIEQQLRAGTIDIGVHSAKDMPSQLPEGFELIAFTEREAPNDVLLSFDKNIRLSTKPLIVGTSSNRRLSTLKRYYPHVEAVPMRGNLQTRMAKMEAGHCQALLLAYAGVHRMGYNEFIVEHLSTDEFTPAVGQGSIAIEISGNIASEKAALIKKYVNHAESEKRLLAERAFLRKLEGGCSIPAFALATLEGDNLTIKGGLISLDGKEAVQETLTGPKSEAAALGNKLGTLILNNGGEPILKSIKEGLHQ